MCVLLLAAGCASPPSAPPLSASATDQASSGPWSGRLSLQVDSEPPQGFHAGFELLGNAQTGELRLFSPLGSALAKLPVGQWTTLGVPLKCLAAAGADVARLDRVFSLESDGKLQLSLSKVALGALNEATHVLDCPTQ